MVPQIVRLRGQLCYRLGNLTVSSMMNGISISWSAELLIVLLLWLLTSLKSFMNFSRIVP